MSRGRSRFGSRSWGGFRNGFGLGAFLMIGGCQERMILFGMFFPVEMILVIEGIKVEIRHQFGFNIVYGFCQGMNEFVEILLVQKYLMAVITIIVESLFTFGYGQEIIIAPGGLNVEEIGPSLTCLQAFREYTIRIPRIPIWNVVVIVRHSEKFYC